MPEAATICPRPLQGGLFTLKVVSESRVTWATSVQILVFLGLSILKYKYKYKIKTYNAPYVTRVIRRRDFGQMYATDRQMSDTSDRRQTRIIA